MPRNTETVSLGLPDFALGEISHPAEQTDFRPLFDQVKKMEMTSDIVIGSPFVEEPSAVTNIAHCENPLPTQACEEEHKRISVKEHEAIVDDLKERFDVELKELREKHQDQVLRQHETFMSGLFENVSQQLEDKVAQALAPLVENCVSENSLNAMIAEIRKLTGKDTLNSLHLSGPLSLISVIKEQLANSRLIIEVEEKDSIELTVCLNDKLISTRLKEWSHRIETALL